MDEKRVHCEEDHQAEAPSGLYRLTPEAGDMRSALGREGVLKDFPDYLRDESNVAADAVEGIFFPRTASQTAWAVEQARRRGMPVTVSGGRTGICAGAVPPGGFLISLERMDQVLLLRSGPRGLEITLESGVRLCDLVEMLRRRDLGVEREADAVEELNRSRTGYLYPPDPTETTATIGGTVATNASGARTFYYGPTREYVTGLEADMREMEHPPRLNKRPLTATQALHRLGRCVWIVLAH